MTPRISTNYKEKMIVHVLSILFDAPSQGFLIRNDIYKVSKPIKFEAAQVKLWDQAF